MNKNAVVDKRAPLQRHVFQGTTTARARLRRRVLLFALASLLSTVVSLIVGGRFLGSDFYYFVTSAAEAVLALATTVLASVLAGQKETLGERIYRWTVVAIPGLCLALTLCNALTVVSSLAYLGRHGAVAGRIISLVLALIMRLVSMECAHLCRKTVTDSVWATEAMQEERVDPAA